MFRVASRATIKASHRSSPMTRGRGAALLLLGAVACISSDTNGPTVQVTAVEFMYQASTSID